MLAGLWVFIAEKLGIPSWPGFIGWSMFFFTGANWNACKESFPPLVLGPILGFLTIFAQTSLGTSGVASALIVVVLGFTMTISQNISIFSAVAVTFVSCNIYFASGDLLHSIAIPSFGLIIGIISIKLAEIFDSIIYKNSSVKEEDMMAGN